MKFRLLATDKQSKARAGNITTGHGEVQTPVFMPIGTAGAVKAVHKKDLEESIMAPMILCNTYHLFLRPGTQIIEKSGGIHKFNAWDRPILTDSGGYQVYSLAKIRKITEEGVSFRSHIDGSRHFFTPENVIDTQRSIGADIIMSFDECTPYPCEYQYAKNSMEMTHRWLGRCIERFKDTDTYYDYDQTLFPIVQGSVYKDLRKQSAEVIAGFGMEGNAIGGLSVGEPADILYEMCELVCDILPSEKPRYLMGVGTPANLLEAIALGVDMFDCVLPTRNARNGMLFTSEGTINIRNQKWEDDFSPVDAGSDIFSSRVYSKAFLRHLNRNDEILASQIATLHNLGFYRWLMNEARNKIIDGTFYDWKKKMVKKVSGKL